MAAVSRSSSSRFDRRSSKARAVWFAFSSFAAAAATFDLRSSKALSVLDWPSHHEQPRGPAEGTSFDPITRACFHNREQPRRLASVTSLETVDCQLAVIQQARACFQYREQPRRLSEVMSLELVESRLAVVQITRACIQSQEVVLSFQTMLKWSFRMVDRPCTETPLLLHKRQKLQRQRFPEKRLQPQPPQFELLLRSLPSYNFQLRLPLTQNSALHKYFPWISALSPRSLQRRLLPSPKSLQLLLKIFEARTDLAEIASSPPLTISVMELLH